MTKEKFQRQLSPKITSEHFSSFIYFATFCGCKCSVTGRVRPFQKKLDVQGNSISYEYGKITLLTRFMSKLWEDYIHKKAISAMSNNFHSKDFDAMSYEELTLPIFTSKSCTMLNQCHEVMTMFNIFYNVKDRPGFTSGALFLSYLDLM